jgi:hypothetical protein
MMSCTCLSGLQPHPGQTKMCVNLVLLTIPFELGTVIINADHGTRGIKESEPQLVEGQGVRTVFANARHTSQRFATGL